MQSLGDDYAFAGCMVAQHRGGAAQCDRNRNVAGSRRQPQHRLDLPRQFIPEHQSPATAERPSWFIARYTLRLPGCIQGSEEIASDFAALLVARRSLAIKLQAFAGCDKQQIP